MLRVRSICTIGDQWKLIGFSFLAFVLTAGLFGASIIDFESALAAPTMEKNLRHVVQFKFKDSSSAQDVQSVVDAFRLLPAKISAVAAFEYGKDNSPEGLADGFTHCFLITFRSESDRDVYLKHPEHMRFVDVLKPHLDKVQVIDYWAQP